MLVTDFCIDFENIANTNATESLDSGISELSFQDQGNETVTEATCLPLTISPNEIITIDDAQTTCEPAPMHAACVADATSPVSPVLLAVLFDPVVSGQAQAHCDLQSRRKSRVYQL